MARTGAETKSAHGLIPRHLLMGALCFLDVPQRLRSRIVEF